MGIKILSNVATPVTLVWERNGAPNDLMLPPETAGRDFLLSLAGVEHLEAEERTGLVRLDRMVRSLGGVLVVHSLCPALLDEFHEARLGADLLGADNEVKAARMAQKFHELAHGGPLPMPAEGYAFMIESHDKEYGDLIKLLPPAPPEVEAEIQLALNGPTFAMKEVLVEVQQECGVTNA